MQDRWFYVFLAVVWIFIFVVIYMYLEMQEVSQQEPLIYVDIPAEDAGATIEHWQPFMDYLSAQLGREVKLMTVTDYAAATEALKYGHADIVRYGTSSYVMAEREVDIIPIASLAKADGSLDTFQSYIIAQPHIITLEGASFAYVDVGSTTGYLLPATYIKKNGIQLGEIMFAGGHPQVIEAVKNGFVDAGACASTRWSLAVREDVIEADELVILWQSSLVPRGPTVVRADMPEELRLAIQEAFISAPTELVWGLGLESYGFAPASPDLFDPMREAQEYLGLTE